MSDVYYDQYNVEINADPYPVYRRLREEAPIYYNEELDFFAVSRFEDVEKGLLDAQTYISGKGAILEIIRSGIEIPPGVIIFEDPPTHTIHRRLLSRAFTPRRVAELEPKIREFCAQQPRSSGRRRSLRLHRRSRIPDAHARDRHAARDPGERSGSGARPRRRQPADRRGQADEGYRELRHRGHVRRLRRLAGRPPVRRHHDRAAQRRIHRRDGHGPELDPYRAADLPRGPGRRR